MTGSEARGGRRYTARFYDDVGEAAARSASVIVPIVTDLMTVTSVLDVGCGTGSWLRAFQEQGVLDIVGLDLDTVPEEALVVDPAGVQRADLTAGFALDRRFDLIVCLEVAEHLPGQSAEPLLDAFAAHGDVVLFSAAIPGQGGNGHVNEQWQSWWAERFEARGYQVFDVIRPTIWMHPDVRWWYQQNTVLYVRGTPPPALAAATTLGILDMVHPEPWTYMTRQPLVRALYRKVPQKVKDLVPRSVRQSVADRVRR